MEQTTDPVLEALHRAARVQDIDLDTVELRAAFASMAPPERRRPAARMALVAASVAAVGVVGFAWQSLTPSDQSPSTTTADSRRIELVAARFDATAERFPLPTGQTYDALRAKVLTQSQDESFTVGTGQMPASTPASMSSLVAKYSGCKWWQLASGSAFPELTPKEQREVQEHSQRALDEVLKNEAIDDANEPTDHLPLSDYWDAACKGDE